MGQSYPPLTFLNYGQYTVQKFPEKKVPPRITDDFTEIAEAEENEFSFTDSEEKSKAFDEKRELKLKEMLGEAILLEFLFVVELA
ncbi:MAG: hypothetical protein ACJAW3_001013 [Lentimonas sp.]|jgi:hypothetical protein